MKQIQAIRGMSDYLPDTCANWQWLESKIRQVVQSYGYREIRTPLIEKTPLFVRSIGKVTDIVEKEIYCFDDRNGENIALRPEGTAGCIRAGIEHGLFYHQIQRLWYMGPFFRYERPQKGRYRQFHQLGVEFLGVHTAHADAEIIIMLAHLWQTLGISEHLCLEINTLGSHEDRTRFRQALIDYLNVHADELDEDSKKRLQKNPLRILDSKNPQMKNVIEYAPQITDYLCTESQQHFQCLQNLLTQANIAYTINPYLVRGLDYYNDTVFEWTTQELGAQSAVCGGGRYNGLVEQLGGQKTPAVGFGLGLERLYLLLEKLNAFPSTAHTDVYLCMLGDTAQCAGLSLAKQIRVACPDLKLVTDCHADSFKKQLKRADKSGAKIALIFGEEEVQNQVITVKDLRDSGSQQRISMDAIFPLLTDIKG